MCESLIHLPVRKILTQNKFLCILFHFCIGIGFTLYTQIIIKCKWTVCVCVYCVFVYVCFYFNFSSFWKVLHIYTCLLCIFNFKDFLNCFSLYNNILECIYLFPYVFLKLFFWCQMDQKKKLLSVSVFLFARLFTFFKQFYRKCFIIRNFTTTISVYFYLSQVHIQKRCLVYF